MKKLLLITLLSLSPIIINLPTNCAQTAQQAQQEETLLRADCHQLKMALITLYGLQVTHGPVVRMYQSKYLQSIGTPIALKLLGQMGTYGL